MYSGATACSGTQPHQSTVPEVAESLAPGASAPVPGLEHAARLAVARATAVTAMAARRLFALVGVSIIVAPSQFRGEPRRKVSEYVRKM
jgi:hypothetical protein